MNTNQKYMLEAYMKPLYDGSPEGPLLESVRSLEQKLTEYADENPSSMDMVGDSGLRDEYNQIYMAVINRNNDYSTAGGDDSPKAFDYSKEQRLPTVHEYLDNYRLVYETSIKPNKRELTDKAYQELFNVENRTDDLMEAQIIIEKEHLIVNTVTAEYKYMAEDFLEAADAYHYVPIRPKFHRAFSACIGRYVFYFAVAGRLYGLIRRIGYCQQHAVIAALICGAAYVETELRVTGKYLHYTGQLYKTQLAEVFAAYILCLFSKVCGSLRKIRPLVNCFCHQRQSA